MENIFSITEEEVINNFKKQNPTTEDYFDIICESQPEFLIKNKQFIASNDANDEIQKFIKSANAKVAYREKRYEIELPYGYEEIELYDNCKCFDENFKIGKSTKYILIEVSKNNHFTIVNPESILPTPQSKCVIDIEKVEEFSSLEFIPIDYETFFGLRFLTFIKYNSDFLLCDERVLFEALLIKFKAFDFKPFFWSKEKIFDEVGIKKDRSTKILDKFLKLGILSKEVKKSFIKNRPMQINYFELDPYKIIELVPKIYMERESINIESKFKEYFLPFFNNRNNSKLQ